MKSAYVTAARGHPTEGDKHSSKYEPVSSEEDDEIPDSRPSTVFNLDALTLEDHLKVFKKNNRKRSIVTAMGAIGAFLFFYFAIA